MEKQANQRKLRKTEMTFSVKEKKLGMHKRERSMMLPFQRSTVLKQHDGIEEVKNFSKLVPGLLENYTQTNMIKCMKDLDTLITNRLTATERQRKFQELADFEKMARENLAIEEAVRLARQKELEAREAEEERKKAETLAQNAADRAGGHRKSHARFPNGGSGSSRHIRNTRGTRFTRSRSTRKSMKAKDAVEAELEKRGVRSRSRGTIGGYKRKLLREKTGLRIGAKEDDTIPAADPDMPLLVLL